MMGGMMKSLSIEIENIVLCGSCRFFTGDPATGNITGKCPIDGHEAHAKNKPCAAYEVKRGGINAN